MRFRSTAQPPRPVRGALPLAVGCALALIGSQLVSGSVLATSALAANECAGVEATIVGTEGDDVLVGTAGVDVILGLGGNDQIDGLGDDDVLCGGPGDDTIKGGPGNDRLDGDDGNDLILGQSGDDQIFAGDGDDTVRAAFGDDLVRGGPGNDLLFGMDGDDKVVGGGGNDAVYGGNGNDTTSGGQGVDIVRGDRGDDIIRGNAGDDVLLGSQGNDTLLGGNGNDRIVGMAGIDLLSGGQGDDRLEGGRKADHLLGGPGDDVLDGGTGIDFCSGGGGVDTPLACESGEPIMPTGEPGEVVDVQFNCVSGTCAVRWTLAGPRVAGVRVDLAFGPCTAACENLVEISADLSTLVHEATIPESDLANVTTSKFCALALTDYAEVDGRRSPDTFANACGTYADSSFVLDGEIEVRNFAPMAVNAPEMTAVQPSCTVDGCSVAVTFVDRSLGDDSFSVTLTERSVDATTVVGFGEQIGAAPGRDTSVTIVLDDVMLTGGDLCATATALNKEFGGGRTSDELCVEVA